MVENNVFLYDDYYNLVHELWDTESNGDIYKINPKRYEQDKYVWICPICNEKFISSPLTIATKISRGEVWCNKCGKGFRLADVGESFQDLYPELSKYWDYTKNGFITPKMINPKSNKKYWWVCPECNSSYERSPNSMSTSTYGGSCKNCYLKVALRENNLLKTFPEIALDWSSKNSKSPDKYFPSSEEIVHWKCHICGCEWDAKINRRRRGDEKCPNCKGVNFQKGVNDFKSLSSLAEYWDYSKNIVKPEDIYFKDKGYRWFICERCGKSFSTTISKIEERGSLCNTCRKVIDVGDYGSIEFMRPDLAKQFDISKNGITPDKVLINDNKDMWWICDKGHSFLRSPLIRSHSRGVCPICNGKEVLRGYNDLKSQRPDLMSMWVRELNNISPEDVTVNSSKVVWWSCPICHKYYEASVDSRVNSICCPHCSESGVSHIEKEFLLEIKSWGVRVLEHAKIFTNSNKSVDIYLPDYSIVIEFNGVYWHSSKRVDSSYHETKYNDCAKLGIKLLFVWEDDYIENKKSVFDYIKNILFGFNASCNKSMNIVKIKEEIGYVILNRYSFSKDIEGDKYFGLKDEEGIQALISIKINYDFIEIKGYAEDDLGGFGLIKLVDYVCKKYSCRKIYCCCEKGSLDEELYINCGFSIVEEYDKYCFYLENRKRLIKGTCDCSTFIWNAGSRKYVKEL